MRTLLVLFSVLSLMACSTNDVRLDGDPNLWLEQVEGEKALEWVKKQNDKTLEEITQTDRYKTMEKESLAILQAKDKIPGVTIRGDYVYNHWQDDKNVRGLWRRTSLASYRTATPQWEVLLDVDQLAKQENENWVFDGARCNSPVYDLCLISLSRGGKDAVVVREFNTRKKKFVKNGFYLKEAKSWVGWIDRNHVFVATNFGEGSLTSSGYPRFVKVWTRGTDLSQARTVREAKTSDMAAFGETYTDETGQASVVATWETFYTTTSSLYENGRTYPIPLPKSAKILRIYRGALIVELRKPWAIGSKSFAAGTLLAVDQGVAKRGVVTEEDAELLYATTDSSSILQVGFTRHKILVNALENVTGKIYEITVKDKKYSSPKEVPLPKNTHAVLDANNPHKSDYFISVNGFLDPDALYLYSAKKGSLEKVKSLPPRFANQGMEVQQRWATSVDGTKIPYFVVGKKEVIAKGQAPTLLYGYGGFEVSLTPTYKPIVGKLWLEKGGVYVMANIRGGGEFGPRWHQAALKTKRQRAYDDFISVAEDLVKTGLTTKAKLAIQGGSNGGLLVATVMTQRPDLFKAVLCHVPLIDMVRYSQLLAGASWMGEYGDPKDSAMRKYILTYSPYHNVKKDKQYPELFLLTSTKDDRVHPGHARKMAARMMNMGHSNIRYYENTEGGHGAAANLKQKARMRALTYEFLFKTIF